MREPAEDKIKRVARETARELIDLATATDSALRATTAQDILYIKTDVATIKGMLDNKYVTKEEFSTVRMIAYGMVGLVMSGVIGGLLILLFNTKK